MMLSPDLFPVPLIHISETNSTNSYLQTFCAKEKTEEFTTVAADIPNLRTGTAWKFMGIGAAQKSPFQLCAFS